MKRFLLLQSRPEDEASNNEYEAFCKLGSIAPSVVHRIRMEKGELPDIDLDDYAAVLMGGGPANLAYGDEQKSGYQKVFEPWLLELFGRIVQEDKPFLGVCLAFSLAVKYLGGNVSFTYGEPIQSTSVKLTSEGSKDPLLLGLPDSFSAIVGHKEGALQVPDPAVELARSEACSQMLRIGKNVYASQFHAELDIPSLILRIRVYQHAGYFEPNEMEQLIAEVSRAEVPYPKQILQRFVSTYQS